MFNHPASDGKNLGTGGGGYVHTFMAGQAKLGVIFGAGAKGLGNDPGFCRPGAKTKVAHGVAPLSIKSIMQRVSA
jgi:hypothetical protein